MIELMWILVGTNIAVWSMVAALLILNGRRLKREANERDTYYH